MTSPSSTAAAVIIGDEILSGKFEDQNTPWLARRCRELGVDLVRVAVVPDIVAEIAEEVRRCTEKADLVFTTGGVGPTHDDLTMAGVAAAFGLPLVRHPELVALIEEHLGDKLTTEALRMAEVPEGAELLWDGEVRFPLVRVRCVHVFPGVPGLLRLKFDAVAHRFAGVPVSARRVTTTRSESAIAGSLQRLQERFPSVAIGSYPQFRQRPWTVTLTLDSRDTEALDACEAAVVALLGDSLVSPA